MARFVAAGAVGLCLLARPVFAETAAGENKIKTYGDWNVACDAEGCRAEQDIHDPESAGGRERATLLAKLFLWRNGDTLDVKIETPLNTALEADVGMFTDGTLLMVVPYRTCRNACVATAQLGDHMTRTLAGAGKIEIAWADLNGKAHYYSVSTAGCNDALGALGAQPGDLMEKVVAYPGDARAP